MSDILAINPFNTYNTFNLIDGVREMKINKDNIMILEIFDNWGCACLKDKYKSEISYKDVYAIVNGELYELDSFAYGSQVSGHGMGTMATDMGFMIMKTIDGRIFTSRLESPIECIFKKDVT